MPIDRDKLMDVLEKAHKGSICKQFDWDTRVIPETIADKLKKFGLQKSCDPANPVNQDLELADRVITSYSIHYTKLYERETWLMEV